MKLIDTRTHGYLDYLMALLLIAAPSVFALESTSAEGAVFYGLGVAAVVYSIFTNYELGLLKVIPMKTHLALDAFSGVFLAVSPWLFDFADILYLPHLILGLIEIVAALMTRAKPRNPIS